MRRTVNSKGRNPRKSAMQTFAAPLVSKEIIDRISIKRSSYSIKNEQILDEEVNIEEYHVGNNDELLQAMREYVNKEYERRVNRGRLRLKKMWKRVRGKDLDIEKEKNEIRQKFILEHLNPEQKRLFAQELLEAKLDEDELNAEINNPKFQITPLMMGEKQGT